MLEELLLMSDVTVMTALSAITAVFVFLSLAYQKHQTERGRWILFLGISIPVAIGSLFLVASTVYENVTSVTGGPVHWHADFQIWNCGEQVDLEDPKGLSNRIGTPLLHEHNDLRIHVEGTVLNFEDVTLPEFFRVIGGDMNHERITLPTVNGRVVLKNGDNCPHGQKAVLQTFVYRLDEATGRVSQKKLTDVNEYRMTPSPLVPPGDCIIIEFGPSREQTDHLCTNYAVASMKGDINIDYGN